MKRYSLLLLALVASMALFGCSGDDGAQGVAGTNGKDGSPQPIKVLFMVVDTPISSGESRARDFNAAADLPPGSEVQVRAGTSTPTLADLTPYDAVFVSLDNTPQAPDTMGNVLADYVDQGGKLVIAHGAFISPTFAITGRIMTTGYSPMMPAPSAGDGADKTINPATVTFPIHPVLLGVDTAAYTRPGLTTLSEPVLDTGVEVIAEFNGGLVAFAVNAAHTIVALNDYPNQGRRDIHKVAGNALLWLTGSM